MRIRNNIPGMGTLRNGEKLNNKISKTLEKLASGYCINRAGDDASGLSVSERLRMNLTLYGRCEDNVSEGMNLAEVAEASLQEVSDMMRRGERLCEMASNGTYTQFERDQMLKELNDLYSEMDRIFQGSKFNEVQLFRHEDEDYSNGEFEYLEEVIPTGNELHMWGELEGVDKKFGTAAPAKNASVTLPLDDDVQTAADLDGKSFTIKLNNYTSWNFQFSTSTSSYGSKTDSTTGESYRIIGIKDCTTVQAAFDKLCDYSNDSNYPWSSYNYLAMDKENTKVNGNAVTLTFKNTTFQESVKADGNTNIYETPDGDGTKANGVIISSSQKANLMPVDSVDNGFTAVGTFRLLPGFTSTDTLTEDMKTTLLSDRLYLYASGSSNTITFSDGPSTNANVVDLSKISNVGDLRNEILKIVNTVPAFDDFSMSQPMDDGTFTLEVKHTSGSVYLNESPSTSGSTTVSTNALNGVISTKIQEAGPEGAQITEIKLPDSFSTGDIPFSLKIKNQTYHFYDGTAIPAGNTLISSYYCDDISGKTADEIHKLIYDRIYSQYSENAIVTRTGNMVTLTAKVTNKPLDVTVTGIAGNISYRPASKSILLGDSTSSVRKDYQGYKLEFDLTDALNSGKSLSEALEGHGFRLNGNFYQFTSASTLNGAVAVNISPSYNIDDVALALQNAIDSKEAYSTVTITTDGNKLMVSATITNTYPSLNFNDGLTGKDGLFGNVAGQTTSETVSGGTTIGKPLARINFSRYNKDNFPELYGKGFRVTCATCPGEYINVIFCYDKGQAAFPESFNVMVDGQERTIHNMVVELKGMNDGSDIVNSIVTQLTPELDHYTRVEVGSPTSVLNVFDIRSGDRYLDGELQQAEIISGVLTNCIYTVTPNFLPAPDAVVEGIEIDFRNVEIFADADSDEGYIKIHLPYLTLEKLKLDPPKPDFSTPEKAMETMDRVLNAHNAISYIRGTIGADYNRLEHAFASLTQSTIQTTDAFSRIRDTDMAKMMMEHVKQSVLKNAQQAMQVHAQNMPQSVLELVKS